MKNVFLFSLLLTSSLLLTAQNSRVDDEQTLRQIVQDLQEAWNNKSGEAFAANFATDHDYIVWDGQYFPRSSKESNAIGHQRLYDGPYKNFNIRLVTDKVRFIRPDVALVHVFSAGVFKGGKMDNYPNLVMSILCEKKDDQWKIISFHNLNIEYDTIFSRREAAKKPSAEEIEAYARKHYPNWYTGIAQVEK